MAPCGHFQREFGPGGRAISAQGIQRLSGGQLQTRKWTDQQGVEKYTTEVVLQRYRGELTLLGGRVDSAGGGYGDSYSDSAGGNGGGGFGSGAGATAPAAAAAPATPPPMHGGDNIDDDIPF